MIDYAILFVCVIAGSLFTIVMKLAERAGLSVLAVGVVNYALAALMCVIITSATCGFHVANSTIILGVLGGISFAVAYFALTHAIRIAGAAIPQVVARVSVVVPILLSIYAFRETLQPIQWIGLAILVVAFPLVVTRAVGYRAIPAKKAIPLLAVIVISIGGNGVLFKLFAESGAPQEKSLFLLLVFAVSGMLTAAALFMKKATWGARELRMGAALAAINVLAGLPTLLLLDRMSGALVFPLLAGGGVIMCIVFARVMLRERLSRRSLIGAVLAAASLFLLKLG